MVNDMHITIAERLRPFSHVPGFLFILPGSTLRFQIFPALIRVHDLSGKEPLFLTEIEIGINGPVQDFTIQQDLEKGIILVWGHTLNGYMRYRITAAQKNFSFYITIEKEPVDHPLKWALTNGFQMLPHQEEEHPKKTFIITSQVDKISSVLFYKPKEGERLSLGNHKKQDWDMMRQRAQMTEIFPLWLRLSQMLPICPYIAAGGTSALLERCRGVITQQEIESTLPAFNALHCAAFEGGLSPRLHDDQHQGFALPPIEKVPHSPLQLLREGAALIRSLFVRCEEDRIHILPTLPPELHCGRFIKICCLAGNIEMEWRK